MFKLLITLFVSLFVTSVIAQEKSDGDYIRLVAELDEPEYYCFDLAGWGEKLRLDDPLQTHTCKLRGGADQMFKFEEGQLTVVGFDRCVEVTGSQPNSLPGSAVLARECNADNPLQKLNLNANGQVQLSDTPYCITAGADSKEAGGPSHMWRTLTLANCDSAGAELSSWQLGL